jgi:molybdopterin molybdotransferase
MYYPAHPDMLTLDEAQAALCAHITPAELIERVSLDAAAGRYVAAPLHALVDNPAFDNSAMDGYALRTADLLAAPGRMLPLHGESSCGDAPSTLVPGTAMRIFTGAPLPRGADTVIIQEEAEPGDVAVRFPGKVSPGDNIRRQGEDFRTDDVLYTPGRRLTIFDLALLSSAGVDVIDAWRRPRALAVATGDELVAPGQPLGPGQIYESNRLAIRLLLQQCGAEVTDGGTVADNPEALRAVLEQAGEYDFVVTSGGASVGDHDLVKQVFAEIGEIHFWKARIKPGKPVAFGRIGSRCHFFALPGNPMSSLVTFKLFVEPALARWHHANHHPPELAATAEGGFRRRPGRMEFLRAHLHTRGDRLLARALPGQGSHMLGTLRETNGFIIVPAESDGYSDGADISVTPLTLDFS